MDTETGAIIFLVLWLLTSLIVIFAVYGTTNDLPDERLATSLAGLSLIERVRLLQKEIPTLTMRLWPETDPDNTHFRDQMATNFMICSVCLEPVDEDESVYPIPCHHLLHAECLEAWFIRGHATCPLCRQVFYFGANFVSAV